MSSENAGTAPAADFDSHTQTKGNTATQTAQRKLFLDGLRGWASVAVLLSHLVTGVWQHSWLGTDGTHALASKVPFVADGTLAVYVFFVLSGFALSTGYFAKRRPAGLARLALQRYLRLAVPIFGVAILTAIFISAGAMHNIEAGNVMHNQWLGIIYRVQPTAISVMRFSFGDALFGGIDFKTSLVPQAWTMPLEFSGSFMVFTLCWIFQDTKQRIPIYLLAALLINVYAKHLSGFIYGMAIAQTYELESFQAFRTTWWGRGASASLLALAAGLSVYQPMRSDWNTRHIWLSFLALLIVLASSCSDWAATALSCRLSVWLGRISFPLYLSHFIPMCSWQSWLILRLIRQDSISLPAIQAISAITTCILSLALATLLIHLDELGMRLARLSSSLVMGLGYREAWDKGVTAVSAAAAAVAARWPWLKRSKGAPDFDSKLEYSAVTV